MLIEQVQTFVDAKTFPSNEEFAKLFISSSRRFIDQEDLNWDFKDQWPFSYSDDYFLGIVRLIAAFANTKGGYIIFGVHDEKRTGGCNKVRVNTDKLRQSIVSNLNGCPDFEVKDYLCEGIDTVTCLLVVAREPSAPPFRFIKQCKYGQTIFVRDGHQVVPADTKHFAQVFCRSADEKDSQPIPGSLPPSARAIRRFVGELSG